MGPTVTPAGLTKYVLCGSPTVTTPGWTDEAQTGLSPLPWPHVCSCPLPSYGTSQRAEARPPRCCPSPTPSGSPTWPTVTNIPRLDAIVAPENSFFRPSVGEREEVGCPAQTPPASPQVLNSALPRPAPGSQLEAAPAPTVQRTSPLTFSGHTVQAIQGVGVAAGGQRVGPCEALPDHWLPWEGPPHHRPHPHHRPGGTQSAIGAREQWPFLTAQSSLPAQWTSGPEDPEFHRKTPSLGGAASSEASPVCRPLPRAGGWDALPGPLPNPVTWSTFPTAYALASEWPMGSPGATLLPELADTNAQCLTTASIHKQGLRIPRVLGFTQNGVKQPPSSQTLLKTKLT